MTGPVIALAADHAGFELKDSMKVVLEEHSFPFLDLGPETSDPVDYPDMAAKLAAALSENRAELGASGVRQRHRNRHRGEPLPLDSGRCVP